MSFVVVLFTTSAVMAQGTIKGTVSDTDSGEPMVGVTVVLQGTARGAITNERGAFSFKAEAGTYTLRASYIGYLMLEKEVTVADGQTVDAGTLSMQEEGVGLDEVNIIASLATDRKTPVAVSTISGEKVAQMVGNQEFPEIMRSTPSIYVTKEGGGFGDSRINVRGFDQRNTAVMINGIPVNDMENGWVYWSNWAGLSDVTSTIQVQRGLGASKLAVPSIGGSINIVTNAADFKKGGAASFSVGNNGYQKYAAVVSTGLGENGWAATAQITHTRGNGYIDGTQFQAYSYFVSASKVFNKKHTLAFTGLGAPQWHHQRLYNAFSAVTLQTFQEQGIRFNTDWGTLDGQEYTWRRNFYHKPKFFINHYWNISDKTSLKSSAYLSFGNGGGTGPRGRLASPTVFDSYSGLGTGIHNDMGQVRWDDLVRYHNGEAVAGGGFGDVDTRPDTTANSGSSGYRDGFIRRASMNYHTWYGVLSTLDHQLSDNLNLVAGLDARYYLGEHFRRVEDLLGNTAYLSTSNSNNPTNFITEASPANFGNFRDNSYKDGSNVLNYWNDGIVTWLGLFTQLEYSTDRLTTFLSLSGSNQGFKRVDYFIYSPEDTPENDINNDGEYQESPTVNKLGGTVKAGLNYNLDESNNIFVNGGYFSRQPIFDNVFINFRNVINENTRNQTVAAFEAGYGYRSANFRANVNVYHTLWGNRQFDQSLQVAINDSVQVDALAVFDDISQLHQGVELELEYKPIPQLTLSAMASLGNWRYTKDFDATITDTDNNQSLGTSTIYAKDLKVGDAAQTTANLRATVDIINGVSVYLQYYYADNLYAPFNVTESQFFSPGPEVVKLPAYGLADAGAFVRVPLGGVNLEWSLNVNNLFNTNYIAELETNDLTDLPSNNVSDFDAGQMATFLAQNFGFYGFGTTWNTSLKIRF